MAGRRLLIPFIDGVNDVRRIAWLADVSLQLTQIALQHLLYYDTIILLDMFFFSSCYAPRPGIHDFVANIDGVVEECANYVCTSPPSPPGAASSSTNTPSGAARGTTIQSVLTPSTLRPNVLSSSNIPSLALGSTSKSESGNKSGNKSQVDGQQQQRVSNYQLIKLMTSFCVGRSIMEWIRLHQQEYGFDVLRHIDVRRLVQFGVIKGYLYRVHKYVVSKQYLALLATGQARPLREDEDGVGATGSDAGDLAGTSVNTVISGNANPGSSGDGAAGKYADPLQRYTDGTHCFDQIITELNVTDAEIMEKIKGFEAPARGLSVFYR